ncbi:murein hydrolase activator EnvC family protein [Sphingomonas sp. Leaf4]|uniref:murein hydrolase activator EnvC family protein n=1 Tax=Sphingomonas sp. Leaf4 TaxID=2876553 RepID=UPI001E56B794|nr:peptidoglycan DD-metalloendopeptidase family protein [Sphingomonas sp. Leaf4]
MKRRIALAVLLAALGGAAAWAQDDPVAAGQARLRTARSAAGAAATRARALESAAASARTAAERTRAAQAAIGARIAAAEADRQAAQARVALIGELLARRQSALGDRRGPIARLVGALQSLASRPAWMALAQPGSTDDLVHVRAVLGTVVPVMRQRTATLRADVAQAARLRDQAGIALAALAQSNRALEAQRLALVQAEAAQRARSRQLARGAMVESDRAIALGEQARDIVDQLQSLDNARDTEAGLRALSGPLPRPGADDMPPAFAYAYRLPLGDGGRLATGFGEVSDSGVRARGLTFTVASGSDVVAPAPGKIAYSGRFRGYGRIVILDHGNGWTTLVTGLSASVGPVGGRVVAGTPIGRAGTGDMPQVTIELRRQGVPVDLAAML